jgi:hypothetical protein
LEDFPWRREYFCGILLIPGHVGSCFLRICFTLISHPGTWKSLKAWFKVSWLLPKLVADIDIVHVMVVLSASERKSYGVMEVSIQISK